MIKTTVVLIMTTMLLSSCNIPPNHNYVVKAGNHFANFGMPTFLHKNTVQFTFTPDSTWIWKAPAKNGWSKVTGIAWNDNHHNSVRLVYMRINDSTGVFGYYAYVNGISPMQNYHVQAGIMDTIHIGDTYHGMTGWNAGKYFVRLNGITDSINIRVSPKGIRTLEHPYIGGTYTINHDWHVNLKFLGI